MLDDRIAAPAERATWLRALHISGQKLIEDAAELPLARSGMRRLRAIVRAQKCLFRVVLQSLSTFCGRLDRKRLPCPGDFAMTEASQTQPTNDRPRHAELFRKLSNEIPLRGSRLFNSGISATLRR